MIFGLTGGIASGKSTVSKTFLKHSILMVDADIIARQVVEPGTKGLQSVVKAFGDEYLTQEKTLDRVKLGNLVFSDHVAMKILNDIMGQLITKESEAQLNKLQDAGHPIIGYDAALICEMGNADKYRPLIVVACDPDTQLDRLMSRNSLTREQAMYRIKAQMPVAQKIALADFVIRTDGPIEGSVRQAEYCLEYLKRYNEAV